MQTTTATWGNLLLHTSTCTPCSMLSIEILCKHCRYLPWTCQSIGSVEESERLVLERQSTPPFPSPTLPYTFSSYILVYFIYFTMFFVHCFLFVPMYIVEISVVHSGTLSGTLYVTINDFIRFTVATGPVERSRRAATHLWGQRLQRSRTKSDEMLSKALKRLPVLVLNPQPKYTPQNIQLPMARPKYTPQKTRKHSRRTTYLPHEAVAENKKPIGEKREIQLVWGSTDLKINWFEVQLMWDSIGNQIHAANRSVKGEALFSKNDNWWVPASIENLRCEICGQMRSSQISGSHFVQPARPDPLFLSGFESQLLWDPIDLKSRWCEIQLISDSVDSKLLISDSSGLRFTVTDIYEIQLIWDSIDVKIQLIWD